MKRLLSVVCTLLMLLGAVPFASFQASAAVDLTWPVDSSYYITCMYYYKTGSKHSTKYGYDRSMGIAGGGNILAAVDGTVETATNLGSTSFGKYASKISFEQNVRLNNASYNSDETVVNVIDNNYYKSGTTDTTSPTFTQDTKYDKVKGFKAYPCVSANFEVKTSDLSTRAGEIYTTDLCTVNELYTNGWCKVTYPVSSGTKTAYTPISNFIKTPSESLKEYISPAYIDLFSTASMETKVYTVYPDDVCYTVGTSGSATQLFMPFSSGSGYALGWAVLPDTDFTVTLDADGGTVSPSTLTVKYGSAIGALPVPSKDGYDFDGWVTEQGLKVDSTMTVTSAMTLKATWKAIRVTGVTLNVGEINLMKGETIKLTAAVTPADAADKTLVWESADENVVAVDQNGTVTAKAVGTSAISVKTKDGNYQVACMVYVKEALPFVLKDSADTGKIRCRRTDDIIVVVPDIASVALVDGMFVDDPLTFKKSDGTAVAVGKVGTGWTVTSGDAVAEIAVCGDVDGDGKVSANDYALIKSFFRGKTEFDTVTAVAADLDFNGNVSSADYIKLKHFLCGSIGEFVIKY